jgi:hypothetical protein
MGEQLGGVVLCEMGENDEERKNKGLLVRKVEYMGMIDRIC